jgi:hypothetical protein
MASAANRIAADAEHGIARRNDLVIAVTGGATGGAHLHEDLRMAALVEQIRVHWVTLAAYISDPGNSRRRCAVIAVALVARRRGQIALNGHQLVMNAFLVLRHLIRRDLVGLHVFRICVASAAGIDDAQRVYRGTSVARRPNGVGLMTARAGGDLLVFLFFEPPAVNRSEVLRYLIDPQVRIVLPHKTGVGVAAAANLYDLQTLWFADVTFGRVHGFEAHFGRIAAMTGNTAEAFRRMNVIFIILSRLGEIVDAESEMTGGAGVILRGRSRMRNCRRPRQSQCQRHQYSLQFHGSLRVCSKNAVRWDISSGLKTGQETFRS